MTAKLSDLRVKVGWMATGHIEPLDEQAELEERRPTIRSISIPELLAMLEAEGVLRREWRCWREDGTYYGPCTEEKLTEWLSMPKKGWYHRHNDCGWQYATEPAWLPREESSDVPKLTPEPSFGTSMTQESSSDGA